MSRNAANALLGILSIALLAPPAFAEASDAERTTYFERRVRKVVAEQIPAIHYDEADLDAEAIIRELIAMERDIPDKNRSGPNLRDWIRGEISKTSFAAARSDAVHDDSYRYAFPYDDRVLRLMTQGPKGEFSHREGAVNLYAFDFALPYGTQIRAAREGEVAFVVDGFVRPPGQDELNGHEANEVVILHEDGTLGHYLHFKNGIVVKRGQRVGRQQLLGYCGQTGRANAPHLHFAVLTRNRGGEIASLPIRFDDGTPEGSSPSSLSFIGNVPDATTPMVMVVRKRQIDPMELVPVRYGDSIPLRSIIQTKKGRTVDVTESGHMLYASMLLDTLYVSPTGIVTAKPTPGSVVEDRRLPTRVNRGRIMVVYDPPGPSVGVSWVSFEIVH